MLAENAMFFEYYVRIFEYYMRIFEYYMRILSIICVFWR